MSIINEANCNEAEYSASRFTRFVATTPTHAEPPPGWVKAGYKPQWLSQETLTGRQNDPLR
jgi:hypothetical protein